MNNTDIDSHFSINNLTNYKTNIDVEMAGLYSIFNTLFLEYLAFIFENDFLTKQDNYMFYIIRGYETISHVFTFILYYTQNIDMCSYHAQKSVCFYVEFLNQISGKEHVYLNLTSQDAVQFVYRKTIYEINNEIRKNTIISRSCIEKVDKLKKYSEIVKKILNYNMYHIIKENCKMEYFYKRMTHTIKEVMNCIDDRHLEIIDEYIDILNDTLELHSEKNSNSKKIDYNIDIYKMKIISFLHEVNNMDENSPQVSGVKYKLNKTEDFYELVNTHDSQELITYLFDV